MTDAEQTAYAFKNWLTGLGDGRPVSNSKLGLIVSLLNDLCGGDERHHKFFRFCFGHESCKQLTNTQLNALYTWLSPVKVDEVGWGVRAKCAATVYTVLQVVDQAEREEQPLLF
jgi:hypothetical protein